MPTSITWGNGNKQYIVYDASGRKLRETFQSPDGGGTHTRTYLGGFEYFDNKLEAVDQPEGRIVPGDGDQFYYEYALKDHLGNTRVTFSDRDGDGFIRPDREILQESHYYPFGMEMTGPWQDVQREYPSDTRYLFNGKEQHRDFGLQWYDYGARWYDPAVGRWWSVDPLAEKYHAVTPYGYALNNPVLLIDPDGMRVSLQDELNTRNFGEMGEDGREGAAVSSLEGEANAQKVAFAITSLMTTPGEPNTASPHVSNDNEEFPNELHTLVVVSTPLPGGTSEKAWKRFNFQFCKWWNSDGVTGLQITTEVLATSLIPGEESIAIAGSSYGRAFMRRLLRSFEENSVKVANKGEDIAVVVGVVETEAAKTVPKVLTQFTESTLDDAVSLTMKQKGTHIFANNLHPKPWLNQLSTQMGGNKNLIRAALQNANGRIVPTAQGIFNTPVNVGGLNFTIRGYIN